MHIAVCKSYIHGKKRGFRGKAKTVPESESFLGGKLMRMMSNVDFGHVWLTQHFHYTDVKKTRNTTKIKIIQLPVIFVSFFENRRKQPLAVFFFQKKMQ